MQRKCEVCGANNVDLQKKKQDAHTQNICNQCA